MKNFITLLCTFVFCLSFSSTHAQCPISAGFNYTINNGYKVTFSSTTKTPNHYWQFGIKNGNGNTSNPTFSYPGPGTYKVCHDVYLYDSSTRKYCSDSICKTIVIPKMCDANASFSLVLYGDSLKFTNNKQSSNTVFWGDGSSSNNVYKKWHYYSKAGTYNVCQIASGYDSSTNSYCEDTICKKITVKKGNSCNADATFYYQIQGNKVYISSKQTTGKHNYFFGDGHSSTSTSPTHTYNSPGTYNICHDISFYDSITKKWCSDSTCQKITIKSNGCKADAKFSIYHSSGGFIYTTANQKAGTHYWSFGDGNSSTQSNANHSYKKTGTYNICHKVTYYDSISRKTCSDSFCKQFVYTNCNVNAKFGYQLFQNGTYQMNPVQKFGQHLWYVNGAKVAQTSNPFINFNKSGNFNVCHKISYYDSSNNSYCMDSVCKTITVNGNCNAKATFGYKKTQNFTYQFNPLQTFGQHLWYINGAKVAQTSNPFINFNKSGTYNVCHKISYYDSINKTYCSDSVCKTITIGNSCNASAKFTYKVLQGQTVKFTPNQTNGKHYWYFHDSTSNSHLMSPTYTFSKPGRYWVCHDVSYYDSILKKWCSDSTCQWVNVTGCNTSAFFNPSSKGLSISLYDYRPNAVHFYSFGDGTNSRKSNPTHTYKRSGNYTICHNISEYDSISKTWCSDSLCQKIYVKGTNPCDADFQVTDSLNTIFLYSNANSRTARHSWSFGDGNSSIKPSPQHTYKRSGKYTICHIVTEYDSINQIICQDSVCKTKVVGANSIFESDLSKTLIIYPNPAKENLNVAFTLQENQNIIIKVLDPTGKVLYSNEFITPGGNNKLKVPLSNLPNGVYLIQMQTNDSQVTRNFIKQ